MLGRPLVHPAVRLPDAVGQAERRDPLRVDPVATVLDGCVGCGLCGENAHAASLCPSFYRGEVIQNPNWRDRVAARVRERAVIGLDAALHDESNASPVAILIGALGGEGGGVLARVAGRCGGGGRLSCAEHVDSGRCATHGRHDVLRRDLSAAPLRRLRGRAPVLWLYPVPGCSISSSSSELLEDGRIVANGYGESRPHDCS